MFSGLLPTTLGMSLSISSAAHSNPYAALVQKQAATADSLFGTASDHPAESAAAAMPLYQKAGLLHGVAQWDGSLKPGSQRTAPSADKGAAAVTPKYGWNPFDQKTWDPKAQTPAAPPADAPKADAPKAPPAGTRTGTGVVVAMPKYSFNPFDQKSWDVKPPKGSTVDTKA
jgi:hypothetical protein